MPHIILEHSSNIEDKIDYQKFCTQMHQIFLDNGYQNPNALKSRYVIHNNFHIGDNSNNSFIHLNISVLKGKTTAQLQTIMQAANKLMRDTFIISNSNTANSFSVEIREINNELYLK